MSSTPLAKEPGHCRTRSPSAREVECKSRFVRLVLHHLITQYRFVLRGTELPGLFILMAGNSTASDKPLDTREGFIEHFYRSTGRTDIEFRELELQRNSFLLIAPGEPTLGPPSWEMTFVCSLARVVSAYAVAILKDLKGQAPLTDLLYRS